MTKEKKNKRAREQDHPSRHQIRNPETGDWRLKNRDSRLKARVTREMANGMPDPTHPPSAQHRITHGDRSHPSARSAPHRSFPCPCPCPGYLFHPKGTHQSSIQYIFALSDADVSPFSFLNPPSLPLRFDTNCQLTRLRSIILNRKEKKAEIETNKQAEHRTHARSQ